jgi:hypothetical protein
VHDIEQPAASAPARIWLSVKVDALKAPLYVFYLDPGNQSFDARPRGGGTYFKLSGVQEAERLSISLDSTWISVLENMKEVDNVGSCVVPHFPACWRGKTGTGGGAEFCHTEPANIRLRFEISQGGACLGAYRPV